MSGTSGMSAMFTDDLAGLRANSSDCPYRAQIATRSDIAQPQVPALSIFRRPSTSLVALVDGLVYEPSLVTSNSQRGPPAFGSANSEIHEAPYSRCPTLTLGIFPALFSLNS
jgi:hypothetical protein